MVYSKQCLEVVFEVSTAGWLSLTGVIAELLSSSTGGVLG